MFIDEQGHTHTNREVVFKSFPIAGGWLEGWFTRHSIRVNPHNEAKWIPVEKLQEGGKDL